MGSLDPDRRADDVLQGLSVDGADLHEHAGGQLLAMQPGVDPSAAPRSFPRHVDSNGNSLLPIFQLSAETFFIIFDFYLSEESFVHAPMEIRLRWFMHPVDRGPCVLLRVCSLWRRICTTRFASYYASSIVSISQGTIPPLPEGREFDPSVDGVLVGECLRHYLKLFSRGSFVLSMVHGYRRPAVIPQGSLSESNPASQSTLDIANTALASLAERCRELIVRPPENDTSMKLSIRHAANAIRTLWPAQGRLHHLETLSIDFGDTICRYRGWIHDFGNHWKTLSESGLFAHAPRLRRLELWRKAIHVLDALHPRLDLPLQQITDFRCQFYDPRSCLIALEQLPSLTTAVLLRYVSYKRLKSAPSSLPRNVEITITKIKRTPWLGYPDQRRIHLAHLSHLSIFCQYGCVDGSERAKHPTQVVRSMMHHPRDIFRSISAPALRHLRIGFASDEAPHGKRSLAAMSGVVGFLRRSECALVELYIFLHTKEIDEYWLSLFRIVPSLRELTLCMPCGVRLSAEVLRALQVMHERQPLLLHLRRFTLITDESPDLDVETDALAEAIESRVGAHERTGGVADNLEIFQLACQGTHRFVWDKEMKTRMKSWVRRGLCVGLAVVDVALPTEFIDIRDQGNFLMDWEWVRYYDDDE